MSVGPSWFGRGIGVGGAMLAITLHPALFVPVVITSAVLTGLSVGGLLSYFRTHPACVSLSAQISGPLGHRACLTLPILD